MMKKILLNTLAIITFFTSNPAFAEDFKPSGNIVTLMPIVIENLDTLEIIQKELDELRKISRENFAKVEEINALYHDIKTELKEELLYFDNKDNKHSQELVNKLSELDKKRMMLTLDCTLRLKSILSEDKFNEVIELLEFTS